MTPASAHAFTPEQLAQLSTVVKSAIREELADAGLRLDDASHQDEAREDFRFIRRLRQGVNGMAAKVGWVCIAAVLGGLIYLVSLGANTWKGLP
jgi:hypothetical protein